MKTPMHCHDTLKIKAEQQEEGRARTVRGNGGSYGDDGLLSPLSPAHAPLRDRPDCCPDHSHHSSAGTDRFLFPGTCFRAPQLHVLRFSSSGYGGLRTALRPGSSPADHGRFRHCTHMYGIFCPQSHTRSMTQPPSRSASEGAPENQESRCLNSRVSGFPRFFIRVSRSSDHVP